MKNKFKINDNNVVIYLKKRDKTILETTVSIEDFEKVSSFENTWYTEWCEETKSYYVRGHWFVSGVGQQTIKLHRFITDCPKGMQVDHINHDTLNNERSNLRIVSHAENSRNLKGAKANNSTGFRNVHWNKRDKKYVVVIVLNGKNHNVGRFFDLEQAKICAESARRKIYGENYDLKVI